MPTASDAPQVRFWRTPDRLIERVWARSPGIAPPSVEVPDGLTIEGELSDATADDVVVVEAPCAPVLPQPAVPATPLSLISDHAFWEVVSGDRSDEAESGPARAQPPRAAEPVPAAASPAVAKLRHAPMRPAAAPLVLQRRAPPPQVAVGVTSRPSAEPVQALQPKAAQVVEVPVPGRGVVVTRRARAEVAAASPDLAEDEAGFDAPVAQPAPFELPAITILAEPPAVEAAIPTEILQQNAGALEGVLEDFNVRGEIVQACPGPVVTLYELEPAPGTKSSRVISLADDIARSMSAISARVAVIPGKNAIGIELPNAKRETVYLR
ncbi:DNA translocase FtsK, partial [Bosea sp. (in: a-proteobacteria)]|uniref:DNA translocase FtsK n=1 Tax=Bosea sp. (in: a-proteobacteria) TaxID=1871050 RepID=UPI0027364AAA